MNVVSISGVFICQFLWLIRVGFVGKDDEGDFKMSTNSGQS